MNENRTDEIIRQYLDRVAEELRGTPAEERDEILSDLRSHIDEAVGDRRMATEAHVRNVLDRLGDPADVAREARGRSQDTTAGQSPVYRRVTTSPGALEIAGIVLTALVWPIGLVLAWVSPRWLTRDKVIATIIPVIGFVLFIGALMPLWVVSSTSTSTSAVGGPVPVGEPPATSEPSIERPDPGLFDRISGVVNDFGRVFLGVFLFVGTLGSPFIAAGFPAIRLQPVEEHFYPDGTRVGNGVPARGAV